MFEQRVMIFDKPITLKSTRKSLKASASTLGLVAGAFSWSGLAQAASEETGSQMLLLPEHYELMENGVVVFKLETGENLSLTSEQYLILDDGLLLITDELAQASVYNLPVMGSVRAQLLSDLAPIATIDGAVAEATPSQTLPITQGAASRLSEQVDLQSYELAQNSDCEDGSDDEGCALPLFASSEASEGLALGMSVAPGAMALLGMLMTSDQPAEETIDQPAEEHACPPPSGPEFWTDADVADSAATAITGSSADSFIGYTAASTSAITDPLTKVGYRSDATFDMSCGGNNFFAAGDQAAYVGSLDYTGASGDDSLTFGNYLADDGTATFDMSLGGNNNFVAGEYAAISSGSIVYTGGAGDDSLTFDDYLAYDHGSATFNMSLGGKNTFVAGSSAASSSGSLSYTGGSGDDSLTFGNYLAFDGTATFDMALGGNNTFVAGTDAAANSGSLSYTGGAGDDSLTFGNQLAIRTGTATFDMSLGGNNTFVAGDFVATPGPASWASPGSLSYTGGSGDDSLTFGTDLAYEGGSVTFDMSLGGNNILVADDDAAGSSGSLSYTGGSGDDSLTFDDDLADKGGSATFDMSLGGNNTFVADDYAAISSGSIVYTGGAGDDSLTFDSDLAYDNGSATFNMSLGGDNTFVASGSSAAYSSGSIAYTGGAGNDSLTFGNLLAYDDGSATFDMSLGGNNIFVAGDEAASDGGVLAYTGGSGDDMLTFGGWLADDGGTATFDMSLGGTNTFVAGENAAARGGSLSYTGGAGDDSLTFGNELAEDGYASFDMSMGGNNTLVAGEYAAKYSNHIFYPNGGKLSYIGGSGVDTLTFGTSAAQGGMLDIRLGDDAAADKVTFEGTFGGNVTIQNFNFNDDRIDVEAGIAATVGEIVDDGLGNLTWTDSSGNHELIFAGIGAGGTGVIATSAELAAAII